jgi:hypothetical protein
MREEKQSSGNKNTVYLNRKYIFFQQAYSYYHTYNIFIQSIMNEAAHLQIN